MVESARDRLLIDPTWEESRVLDLYAGSGALGIEALSRGARLADFVDQSPAANEAILANLRQTGLGEHARVHRLSVAKVLARQDQLRPPYDLILLDPPYADPDIERILEALGTGDLLHASALVVVEHSRRVSLATSHGKLHRLRLREHGDSAISLFAAGDLPPEIL